MSNLCIFPQDETTAFLRPIDEKLQSLGFVTCDGDTNNAKYVEDLLNCIPNYDNIVFLGHGSSNALSGSNFQPLITAENVGVLRKKKLFLLACNSNEFLSSYGLNDSIGFDIIPTCKMDVNTIFEQDSDYFEVFPDDADLEWFKMAVVRIIANSFDSSGLETMPRLYNLIKMNTNRERFNCIHACRDLHYRDILKMLFDFKDGMVYSKG